MALLRASKLRLIRLTVLVSLVALAACSDESGKDKKEDIDASDKTTRSIPTKSGADAPLTQPKPEQPTQIDETDSLKKPTLVSSPPVEDRPTTDIDAKLLAELEESLKGYDDRAIMQAYGPEGSAVAVFKPTMVGIKFEAIALDLTAGSSDLLVGGSGLQSGIELLAKAAQDISGVTGIVSDPSGFGFTVDMSGDYLFAYDEFELGDEAKASLEKIWDIFQKYDGDTILIEGHTDSKGSVAYNLALSKKRATSVQNWFLAKGVKPDKITSIGKGESQPVAPNQTERGEDNPEGRALNRRVTIVAKTASSLNK